MTPILMALLLAPVAALNATEAGEARVFNVRTFGATGDGVTLDTQSVQAAIAACHARGGGVVELPAGSDHVGTLEMLDNVTLKLDGGRLENVSPERLTMEDVGGPIFIRLGNRGRLEDVSRWDARDVVINGRPTNVESPPSQPQG